MIKLLVWDWNGTLLADTRQIYLADNEVIKAIGIREASYKEFLDLFDIPVKDYYVKLGANEQQLSKRAMELERIFHNSYEKPVLTVRTRAHTREILKFVKSKGIKSLILSNHIKDSISEELLRRKLETFFVEVLGNPQINIAFQSRSKKSRLENYLLENKYNPNEILIIGDGVEEIKIAQELNSKVVAITHGNYSTARLKAAKPDYLINSLLEIKKIISELSKAKT